MMTIDAVPFPSGLRAIPCRCVRAWKCLIGIVCVYTVIVGGRAQAHPFTGMVAFGDSLSDGGNMNYVVSGLGEKTAQFLTGFDPNYYYNYRFSNGPVWVDYLYTNLGFGPLGSMGPNDGVNYMDGTNFSWAGSRSGGGVYGGIFPNLLLQISTYATQRENGNPALPDPATTLFAVWSGANDVFAYVESNGTEGISPDAVAANIASAVTALYGEGGRYFLVPNLPRIGDTPSYRDNFIKSEMANGFVDVYNAFLDSALEDLSETLEGVTIFKLDVNQLFLEIMEDPFEYGFTNTTETAYIRFGEQPYEPRDPPYGTVVPNPDDYFYWDPVHGTAGANFLIADSAYQLVMVPEPSVLWLLVSFLLAFGCKPVSRQLSRMSKPTTKPL